MGTALAERHGSACDLGQSHSSALHGYIDSFQFLSPDYNSHEIYIRSTNVNRTLASAMSNMIGMYGQASYAQQPGQSPDASFFANTTLAWPSGLVPIAIHTVDSDTDYIGDPDCACARRDDLLAAAATTKQYMDIKNSDEAAWIMQVLNNNTGLQLPFEYFYVPLDAINVEQLYFARSQMAGWLTDKVIATMDKLFQAMLPLTYGVGLDKVNGVDIGLEIMRTKGGPMINTLVDNMHRKLSCIGSSDMACKSTQRRKYQAFSAHDTTITALLYSLSAKQAVVPGGFPVYSACVLVETFTDVKNASYVRFMYRANETAEFEPFTKHIPECALVILGDNLCPIEMIEQIALKMKPAPSIEEYCQQHPFKKTVIEQIRGRIYDRFSSLFSRAYSTLSQYFKTF